MLNKFLLSLKCVDNKLGLYDFPKWKADKIIYSKQTNIKYCPSVTNASCIVFTSISYLFSSYLALVAGLASEADFIFIPEEPAVVEWPVVICDKILQVYDRRRCKWG